MKNFEVSRLENSSYDYLVIATTYISPISTLDEVQKAFKNISGKILFNLTLINGLNSNRYISAIIENAIVNRKSFLIEKDVDDPVIHDSISFFSKHAEIVENGTISKALKNLLISGENI